jgi:hypothetical protein
MTIVLLGGKKLNRKLLKKLQSIKDIMDTLITITDDVSLPTNGDEEKKKPGAS